MGTRRRTERDLLADLRDLGSAGLAPDALFRQLHPVLGAALGFDAGCWHESDPVTGLMTSTVADGLDGADFALAVHLELWSGDATTFASIRRSGRLADSAHRVTGGHPERSVRYRELVAGLGFADELRVSFDVHGGRWGVGAFMRAPDRGPFPPAALALAERAARLIGAALRNCALPAPREPDDAAPAVVVLGPTGTLVAADGRAQALLDELRDDAQSSTGIPSSFLMAAEQARGGAGRSRVMVRAGGGRWLVVHASLLEGRSDGQVALVATPASAAEAVPITLLAHGFSPREREVALQVIRGLSTRQIAALLSLTAVTVQDHLKSIFDKTGVRSRRELVALFLTPKPA